MSMFSKAEPETCPTRHPKPVIGSCSLCRQKICEECLGLNARDKLICKFCLAEMKGEEGKKEEKKEPFLVRILGFGKRKDPEAFKLKEGEDCHSGLHKEEVTDTCQICRKSMCPSCISPKTVSGKRICNSCFITMFQVRDEIKQQESEEFIGGIRNFSKFISVISFILLLVFLFIFGVSSFTLGFFNFLHPESFSNFNQDWNQGNYGTMITHDAPELFSEMGERFWYYWWKSEGWRMSYEDWKEQQLEDEQNEEEEDEDE